MNQKRLPATIDEAVDVVIAVDSCVPEQSDGGTGPGMLCLNGGRLVLGRPRDRLRLGSSTCRQPCCPLVSSWPPGVFMPND